MFAVKDAFLASKQTAGRLQVYDKKPQTRLASRYSLPFEVEYQLAQDVAFIAAYEEQASAVSAVSITEQAPDAGITFTVASNAGVCNFVQDSFREISRVLEKCARKGEQICLPDYPS